SFRSIFMPFGDTPERRYVVGADVFLGDLHSRLRRQLVKYIAAGLSVSIVFGLFAGWLGRRIAKPIAELTDAIDSLGGTDEAVSDSDNENTFTDRPEVDQLLREITASRQDESGRLAMSMLAM